jgi:hypothetical protein
LHYFLFARQPSMIASSRDQIGGLSITQDCPFAAQARMGLVLSETVRLRPLATGTLCQAYLQRK